MSSASSATETTVGTAMAPRSSDPVELSGRWGCPGKRAARGIAPGYREIPAPPRAIRRAVPPAVSGSPVPSAERSRRYRWPFRCRRESQPGRADRHDQRAGDQRQDAEIIFNWIPAGAEKSGERYFPESGQAFAQQEEEDQGYKDNGRVAGGLDQPG